MQDLISLEFVGKNSLANVLEPLELTVKTKNAPFFMNFPNIYKLCQLSSTRTGLVFSEPNYANFENGKPALKEGTTLGSDLD
jgi:hypothetical protein